MATKQERLCLNPEEHTISISRAAEEAVNVISNAADVASKKIAHNAEDAAKVVADAASVSVKVLHEKNVEDHDLLIQLKTAMEFIRNDIKDLSSGVTQKISLLEQCKTEKKEFDELKEEIHGKREDRMRNLENKISTFMVTQGLLMVFLGGLVAILLFHIFGLGK